MFALKKQRKCPQYIIIKDYNRVEEKSDAQELLTPWLPLMPMSGKPKQITAETDSTRDTWKTQLRFYRNETNSKSPYKY